MDEQTPQKKKKGTHVVRSRAAFVIVAAALIFYGVVQVISAFANGIQTIDAAHVVVDDSFSVTGWLIRDESVVTGSASNTVKHIVFSGERVQKDAPLAILYSDEQALQNSQRIEKIDEQISLLQSTLQSANGASDSAKIDRQITSAIQNLAKQVKQGSGAALSTLTDSMRSQALAREAVNIDSVSIADSIESLSAERSSLSAQISGRTSQISAPASGYYSEITDGYETILTKDSLADMTLESFQQMLAQDVTPGSGTSLGKIIFGFEWYLAAEITAEQAEKVAAGQSVKVRFTSASIESPATVYAVRKTDNGNALLIVSGDEFNSEIVSMREQDCDIILGTYSGIRVPKEAVRMQDDQMGVYILSGSINKFKTITPLFDAGTFYVVKQTATDASSIVAQDKIVIRGKGLQNNMVVK